MKINLVHLYFMVVGFVVLLTGISVFIPVIKPVALLMRTVIIILGIIPFLFAIFSQQKNPGKHYRYREDGTPEEIE